MLVYMPRVPPLTNQTTIPSLTLCYHQTNLPCRMIHTPNRSTHCSDNSFKVKCNHYSMQMHPSLDSVTCQNLLFIWTLILLNIIDSFENSTRYLKLTLFQRLPSLIGGSVVAKLSLHLKVVHSTHLL